MEEINNAVRATGAPAARRPAQQRSVRRRAARLATALGLPLALLGGGLAGVAPAAAAPGPGAPCPPAYTGPLTEGQTVDGLTTTRGIDPEPFTGTYYDTVPNGIGRGRDMLVFRIEGSRITHPDGSLDAGVWAGMSGSPVYDRATGHLIGAIAYGRSDANDVLAGVTPAADMFDDLLTAPRSVKLTRSARAALAADGVSVPAGTALRRLDAPRYYSGVAARPGRVLAGKAGLRNVRFAGAGSASSATAYPIVAGGNIAASIAYGDITGASFGTVTAVCGDQVLAFGHPDGWEGTSTQTIHGARALTIHANGGAGSFKDIAEIGLPVGSLLQDRLAGISGRLGPLPKSALVTSSTTRPDGRVLSGRTVVTQVSELPFVVGMQASADTMEAMNAEYVTGEAEISWRIDFTRRNGTASSFTRSQRYSTRAGLELAVTADVSADVDAIVNNEFEDVQIQRVHLNQRLSEPYRAYRIGKVEWRAKKSWKKLRNGAKLRLAAKRKKLTLRVRLVKHDRHSRVTPLTRKVTFRLPRHAAGPGQLTLTGSMSAFDEDEAFFALLFGDDLFFDSDEFGEDTHTKPPKNLDQLLASIKKSPRQDRVSAALSMAGVKSGPKVRERRLVAPGVVAGDFAIKIRKKRR